MKTKILLFLLIFVASSSKLKAQTTTPDIARHTEVDKRVPYINDSDFYPEFPGGNKALQQYLLSHIKYPEASKNKNIEGRVILKMVIERTGAIGKVTVLKSVSKDIDNEAIRVVKGMPKWTPRIHNWKKISSIYMLPITFKLN